jgi:tetratricopeptide (TPR) repeat protein
LPGTRPGIGDRPGNRPGIGDRPGNRPGIGDRPTTLPGLPGFGGDRPDRPNRPSRPGIGERPERPSQLPNRPNRGDRIDRINDRFRDRDYARDRWRDRWDNHRHDWDRHWNDRHWYHHHWHHGFWPVYRPGYWAGYWWNRYPVLTAFGITTWAVNRVGWATGYYSYYNPYATPYVIDQSSVYYNYSQPIQVVESYPQTTDDGTAVPPDVSDETLSTFDRAMQEFYDGQYETALNSANEALKELPNDAAVHEFRALVLFALGRYEEAAATLYAVLSVGPGWDWTTMSSLYPSVDVYTKQLRALEAYRNEHPKEAAPRFVLAYHYITQGHEDAAAGQLKKAVQLNPKDELARNMLLSIDPDADVPKPEITEPPKPAAQVQKAQLVGKWTAQRGGDQFVMDLKENGDFTWTYTPSNGDGQDVNGVWAVDEDSIIALDMGEDDTMLAQLNLTGGTLEFYMLGDTQGAEPLKFEK